MPSILVKNIEIQNPFVDSFVADILIENEKIINIASEISQQVDILIDGTNKIITPGLIDRHTHGGYGCNFNTCDENELQCYLINVQKHGIKAVVPTIMTDSLENINRQVSLIKNVISKGAKIIGIHLEGPFINPVKKGIHPENYILSLTRENLEKIDLSFVKILTFAPELDITGEFMRDISQKSIILSAGHTDCLYDLAKDVLGAKINQITHAFNAMRPIHHREPSLLGAALVDDNVTLEVIMDLEHIHKSILEMILKMKKKENILLISDALPISYSGKKEDFFAGEKIYLSNNKATSADGVLAGSCLFFDDIYKKVNDFIPFKDFVGYASSNIAKSLYLNDYKNIEPECDSFVFWDKTDYSVIELCEF